MNNIELFVGCDPDTKYQAFASVNFDLSEIKAWVIRSKSSDELVQCRSHDQLVPIDDNFIAMVEGQKVYAGDERSNPASMIKLARASGIACSYLAKSPRCKEITIALPQEWKGSKQKHSHQAQILRQLGQTPIVKGSGKGRYCVPKENFLNLSQTEYKHVVDAIGMALKLRHDYLWNQKKEKFKDEYESQQ